MTKKKYKNVRNSKCGRKSRPTRATTSATFLFEQDFSFKLKNKFFDFRLIWFIKYKEKTDVYFLENTKKNQSDGLDCLERVHFRQALKSKLDLRTYEYIDFRPQSCRLLLQRVYAIWACGIVFNRKLVVHLSEWHHCRMELKSFIYRLNRMPY